MSRPPLSIVIPVYDNWWLTERCLRELDALRDASSVSFETIVVDNASRDETPEAIALFPWVRYLRLERNRNFAGGCNAGVRAALAPLALLLNNDAYPLGDALPPLVRAFERAEVALAGGALFFEDGVTQAAGLVLLRDAHWHHSCRNLPADLQDVTAPRDALAVSGAAMAVRTDWFVGNGGFDESFVNGFEDVDLCMRAREQGRTIAYVADARFAHYEAASAGRFEREAQNERRFYERWSASLGPLPRTARGDVGAIAVQIGANADPLLQAALIDLEAALRSFGHPVVRGDVAPWQLLDPRFRRAASLGWFTGSGDRARVNVAREAGAAAAIRTHGAASLKVPWLPCADVERIAALPIRLSTDPACNVVAVAGSGDAALAEQLARQYATVRVTPEVLLADRDPFEVACVVHLGLTDESAFGTVLLAQAGLPAVVPGEELRTLFADDVVAESVAQLVGDPAARVRYARLLSADARRRFSPRRSAIRVVDLLCAARFGLERPAAGALSNTPLYGSRSGVP